jgi:hypothetical protein
MLSIISMLQVGTVKNFKSMFFVVSVSSLPNRLARTSLIHHTHHPERGQGTHNTSVSIAHCRKN